MVHQTTKEFDSDVIEDLRKDISHISWALQTDVEMDILDQADDYDSREFCETVNRIRGAASDVFGADNVSKLIRVIADIEKHLAAESVADMEEC